jgi:hypothetical protein
VNWRAARLNSCGCSVAATADGGLPPIGMSGTTTLIRAWGSITQSFSSALCFHATIPRILTSRRSNPPHIGAASRSIAYNVSFTRFFYKASCSSQALSKHEAPDRRAPSFAVILTEHSITYSSITSRFGLLVSIHAPFQLFRKELFQENNGRSYSVVFPTRREHIGTRWLPREGTHSVSAHPLCGGARVRRARADRPEVKSL